MSDFLKRLKEAVEQGKPDEGIKAGFDEILNKAEQHAADPNAMKAIKEKYEKINEEEGKKLQKLLTLEDVEAFNKAALAEEERMLEVEQKTLVTSGVIALNCEIEQVENEVKELEQKILDKKALITDFTGRITFLQGDAPYKEKKELLDKSINDFNTRTK